MRKAAFLVATAVVVSMHAPAFAQQPPGGPPGGPSGGGGQQPQTLATLNCTAAGDITRFNGTAWVCSPDLTTLENQNLDSRLDTLEGQNLDSRLRALEGNAFLRTVVVSPVGPTALDNGLELLTSLDSITDNSASNPHVLLLESGTYDLGAEKLVTKPFVDIVGLSSENTTIQGNGARVIEITDNTTLSDITVRHLGSSSAIGILYLGSAGSTSKLWNMNVVMETSSGEGRAISSGISGLLILTHVTAIGTAGADASAGRAMTISTDAELNDVIVEGDTHGLQNGSDGTIVARNSRLFGGIAGLLSNAGGTTRLVNTQVEGVQNDVGTVTCVGAYDGSFVELDASCN